MISAGIEGRLPFMTYPEPWRGPPKQPPEFLRPAPKPLPTISRYNGISSASSSPNGARLAVAPGRPLGKYPHTVTSLSAPVNLTKDETGAAEEPLPPSPYSSPYGGLFPPTFPPHFGNYSLYPSQYAHIIRPAYPASTPLSPLDPYSPTTPAAAAPFLPPAPAAFSPPKASIGPPRDKRTPPSPAQPTPAQQQPPSVVSSHGSFKIPSKETGASLKGKEGSLKHRILREETQRTPMPLDLHHQHQHQLKPSSLSGATPRKRLPATVASPPRSPLKGTPGPSGFNRGALIELSNGELRRVEDMRTEDFVLSAQQNPELRLTDSTVVRIEEDRNQGKATITLSYNQRRQRVELESSSEHPYFVYGQGWASCNPEKTEKCFGFTVHRLQVGDVLITLTPREAALTSTSRTSTIMTTATTTSMTVRQVPTSSMTQTVTIQPVPQQVKVVQSQHLMPSMQMQPINLQTGVKLEAGNGLQQHSLSPESLAARKRRWSAPDQLDAAQEDHLSPKQKIRVD